VPETQLTFEEQIDHYKADSYFTMAPATSTCRKWTEHLWPSTTTTARLPIPPRRTIHPGLIWRADYNFYGYGEGGPSCSQYCSTSTTLTSTVVPCTSLPEPTGLTESPAGLSAPRNFHANNVTLGLHYEF